MQARTATTNIQARDFVAGIRGFPSLASTACVTSFSPRRHTSHTTAYCLSETHLNTYQTWLTLYCSIRRKLRSLSQTGQCLLSCGPRSATPPLEPHTNILFSSSLVFFRICCSMSGDTFSLPAPLVTDVPR